MALSVCFKLAKMLHTQEQYRILDKNDYGKNTFRQVESVTVYRSQLWTILKALLGHEEPSKKHSIVIDVNKQ